ncbi:peptidylprolyl isomerase [Saccharibacillus alkalitolerans]|uniref:Peptidylprolyl isomerase n=1 Tax=Saccharibacillus alkalitolerans TaxID=2705290 RepID=A0ABX0FD73_9BACL|nr:peptidylprolyl isomerase [Saccharibacillus alkalitolerans]NGZ78135.1 peptidylprolyl isomerase [Saccharibacillus alkalitolerans]
MMQSSHKKWGKLASLGAVAVLSFSVLAACGDKADNDTAKTDDSKVLATYDGGTVTEDQFNTELNVMKFLQPTYASLMDSAEIKNYMLDQQIAYNYLEGKATDEEKKKGADMATEQIDQLKAQVDQEQLDTMLTSQNITEQDLTTYMTQVMTAVQYMSDQVTDEEVQKEYDANKEAYITADVRHILINFTDAEGSKRTDAETLKLAKEAKARVDKGEDFAKVAEELSEDPGSASNGGLYADAAVSQWVEAFKKAAMEQEVGVVGDPVKTEYGYHVIKVEKRNDTLTDEVKESVRRNLASTKLNDFMEKELKGITKSKEEFKDEEAPAAGDPNGAPAEGTDGTSIEGTDGAATEGADQGAPADQGAATDGSGDAGTTTDTKTDGK